MIPSSLPIAALMTMGVDETRAREAVAEFAYRTLHDPDKYRLCMKSIMQWKVYAEGEDGKTIKMAGAFIASRIAQLRTPPGAKHYILDQDPDWWLDVVAQAMRVGQSPDGTRHPVPQMVSH